MKKMFIGLGIMLNSVYVIFGTTKSLCGLSTRGLEVSDKLPWAEALDNLGGVANDIDHIPTSGDTGTNPSGDTFFSNLQSYVDQAFTGGVEKAEIMKNVERKMSDNGYSIDQITDFFNRDPRFEEHLPSGRRSYDGRTSGGGIPDRGTPYRGTPSGREPGRSGGLDEVDEDSNRYGKSTTPGGC